MEEQSKIKGFIAFITDITKIVIISLIIIIPVRYFIVQPFFVRGASMEPTYNQGDYLLVDELSYRFSEPLRGDVIIFKFPNDTTQFYIKRIIGLPKETISINNGRVIIKNGAVPQGFVLDESYLLEGFVNGSVEIKLDNNEYFVLGDNRGASHDSRRWGPLQRNFIIGKVFLRAWPLSNFSLIKTPTY